MFCRRRRYRNLKNINITQEELINKIKEGAVLLDVRSKQEYDEGHLKNAINVPEHEIDRMIEKNNSEEKSINNNILSKWG